MSTLDLAAVCSTVMITGNMRGFIENLFAAAGAFATKVFPGLALGIPVVALLIVLLRCEAMPRVEEER
ncbi:uncharacterized membrane protein YoaK (UPF0700 family) [Bradyrhizobium sp. USDA 4486]